MSDLREILEEKRQFVFIGFGVVILISILIFFVQITSGRETALVGTKATLTYFDMTNQKLVLVDYDAKKDGPAKSPLQGTEDVFLATVFACKQCPEGALKDGMSLEEIEAAGMFITYVEKVDLDGEKNEWHKPPTQYRSLDNPTWHMMDTAPALALLESHLERCEDAVICTTD